MNEALIKPLLSTQFCLGESPVFLSDYNTLFWIDLLQKNLFSFNISTNTFIIYELSFRPTSLNFIGNEHTFISFLSSSNDSVFLIKADVFNKRIESETSLYKLSFDESQNSRFNDALYLKNKDILIIGLVPLDPNQRFNSKGCFYLLDTKVFALREKVTGLDWPNGAAYYNNNMYLVDSFKKKIMVVDIEKYCFSDEISLSEYSGFPDGICVMNEDMYCAMYNGSQILQISLNNTKNIKNISFPAIRPTSCCVYTNKIAITSCSIDFFEKDKLGSPNGLVFQLSR